MDKVKVKVNLRGKTSIVTGASSGIGKETARELAARGARVILACRNASSAELARKDIADDTGNDDVIVKILDLSSLKSIRDFADDFKATENRLDLLVNNAGLLAAERRQTEDGFEIHFGTNHLGPFYLTNLLLEKLVESAPSRIVTVSSEGHECFPVDFQDIQTARRWGSVRAYGRSKTANILFTTHLSKLLDGTGVTCYCLNPGIVRTNLAREFSGSLAVSMFNCIWSCCCGGLLTPAEGAATTIYCSVEPSIAGETGQYYSKCRRKRAKPFAVDPLKAETLWKISSELCRLDEASDRLSWLPAAHLPPTASLKTR